MTIAIIDSTTASAVNAATDQATQLTALKNSLGNGNITVELLSSAGTVLGTVVQQAPTIDLTVTPRRLKRANKVSQAFVAQGTVATVRIKSTLGASILTGTATKKPTVTGDFVFAAAVEQAPSGQPLDCDWFVSAVASLPVGLGGGGGGSTSILPGRVTTPITSATGTIYHVGPGQAYTADTMPWQSLVAGDVVNLHYQVTPYNTMPVLSNIQGTSANWIRIHGVTDANGNRPILSGENAHYANDHIALVNSGSSPWWPFVEGRGVITFCGAYGQKSKFIHIDSIEIRKQGPTYNYYKTNGTLAAQKGGGGVYGVVGEDILIENCGVDDATNCIFVNSRNNDPLQTSYRWTVRNCHFVNYGVPNNFLEHATYIACVDAVYEGNFYGRAKPLSQGGMLKDRSSNPKIIANRFEVGSSRVLDIVEDQSGDGTGLGIIGNSSNYNGSFIVGNLFLIDANFVAPFTPFHFGAGDVGANITRTGPHYFHNNTVLVRRNGAAGYLKILMFWPEVGAQVFLENNIIDVQGYDAVYHVKSDGNNATPPLVYSGKNYRAGFTAVSEYAISGVGPILNDGNTITSGLLINDATFELLTGSSVINQGALPVPGSVQPVLQYSGYLTSTTRTVIGGSIDLGGLEK